MLCSVIVPTWNEEMWLPRLLHSLKANAEVGEIIVCDYNSDDATVAIAKEFGCTIVAGGRPATARNAGARIAKYSVLAFVDADAIVPSAALTHAVRAVSSAEVSLVHYPLTPLTDRWLVRMAYRCMNTYFSLLNYFPVQQGVGSFLVTSKSVYERSGHFDETMLVGEDADFVRKVSKLGLARFDRQFNVVVSARRFQVENGAWFILKTLLWAVLRLAGCRASILPYRWTRYPRAIAEREQPLLERHRRILLPSGPAEEMR